MQEYTQLCWRWEEAGPLFWPHWAAGGRSKVSPGREGTKQRWHGLCLMRWKALLLRPVTAVAGRNGLQCRWPAWFRQGLPWIAPPLDTAIWAPLIWDTECCECLEAGVLENLNHPFWMPHCLGAKSTGQEEPTALHTYEPLFLNADVILSLFF